MARTARALAAFFCFTLALGWCVATAQPLPSTQGRVVVEAAPPAPQPFVTELAIPVPPQIERRSRDPEVSTGLVDIPCPLRVLDDPLLAVNLSLFVGHSDPLGHLVP